MKRLVDIGPAFEALAKKREAKAQGGRSSGDKTFAARDNYFIAGEYWASAMWTIDEVDDKLHRARTTRSARTSTNTWRLPTTRSNGSRFPIAARRCPRSSTCRRAITSGSKVPVIVVVSGMDGFKERSVALYNDHWMQRGYAVLAFEGPGYWEPPLRGIYVDVPGWAETGKDVCDWLEERPEIDADKIGMTGVELRLVLHRDHDVGGCRAIKACAVTGTCYEPGGETIFNQASPTFKKRFMFMSGITDEQEFDEFRKTIDWNGYAQKIKGAYLVAVRRIRSALPARTHRSLRESAGRPEAAPGL